MSSCKDCINADVCDCRDDNVIETVAMNLDENNECKLFKDKSRFVELSNLKEHENNA